MNLREFQRINAEYQQTSKNFSVAVLSDLSNIHGEGGLGDVAQVTYTGQEGKVEEEDQEEDQWHRNRLPGQHVVEGGRGRYKKGGKEMGRILSQ